VNRRPRIVGWQRSGAPIWSAAGASPDDSSNGDTSGGAGLGTGSGTGGSGSGTGEGSSGNASGDGNTGEDDKVTLTKAEHAELLDQIRNLDARMKAADQRASNAERKIQDKENEGKPELDRVKAERDTAVEERDTIKDQLRKVAIKLAFVTVPGIQWHDPSVALKLVESELPDDVVGKDGTVDDKAIERVAKQLASEKKFLVKTEGEGSGEGKGGGKPGGSGSGSGGSGGGAPSGSSVGSSGNGADKDKAARKQELGRRIPALGGRGR
jgi:hypothetical protein